ncbi:hypothetical protein CPB86DRAFT_785787 [Serendipita vermifera]|nr:hypothetical protein CPB86DRAFT_785787 [Serendipita vermifera]
MSLVGSLVSIFDDVVLTRYFAAIGFSILCYDSILTFDDEIRLVWPEKWTLVKILFYINRVVSIFFISLNTYHLSGVAPPFSNSFCQVLILTTGYGAIFSFAITNWLLLARALALWGGTRKIVWCMTIFYLITYMATITVATIASLEFVDSIFYSPVAHVCGVTVRPRTLGSIWVPSICFELVLFTMLFIKLIRHAQLTAGTGSVPRLIRVLHRDGIMYFLVIFCLRMFNLIAWAALPLSLIFLGFFLLWSCTTVLLTRMHLNLKALGTGAAAREQDLDGSIREIRFNHESESSHALSRSFHGPPPPSEHYQGSDEGSAAVHQKAAKNKKGKKKYARREERFTVDTNIFPGGTRIYGNDDVLLEAGYGVEQIAATRPGTASQSHQNHDP